MSHFGSPASGLITPGGHSDPCLRNSLQTSRWRLEGPVRFLSCWSR